jgi:hypothetical protein
MKKEISEITLPEIRLKKVPSKEETGLSVSNWVEVVSNRNPSAVEITHACQFLFRPEAILIVESQGDISNVEIFQWYVGGQAYIMTPVPLIRWLQRDLCGLLPCQMEGSLLKIIFQLDPFGEEDVFLKLALRGTAVRE